MKRAEWIQMRPCQLLIKLRSSVSLTWQALLTCPSHWSLTTSPVANTLARHIKQMWTKLFERKISSNSSFLVCWTMFFEDKPKLACKSTVNERKANKNYFYYLFFFVLIIFCPSSTYFSLCFFLIFVLKYQDLLFITYSCSIYTMINNSKK